MKLSTTPYDIKLFKETDLYATTWPSYGWLSAPKQDTKCIKQITHWNHCREVHIGNLRQDLINPGLIRTDTEKTRFLLRKIYGRSDYMKRSKTSGSSSKRWAGLVSTNNRAMCVATQVLNIIEKEVGWELTQITKVKLTYTKRAVRKAVLYMVTGPPEWMEAIPLLSLYLLIIRTSWFREFSMVKTIEDVEPACEKITKSYHLDMQTKKQVHIKDLNINYKYWLDLIFNKDAIFKNRKRKELFLKNVRISGITALVRDYTCVDKATRIAWKGLLKKG